MLPPPSQFSANASILERIKEGYLMWMNICTHIPKGQRYTIGTRIENKFLDLLELSHTTYFTGKENKSLKILECITLLDSIKFLTHVAWQAKIISHKHYGEMLAKLNEIGKMFGGWKKNIENNPEKKNRAL